jgi:predicted NBD/HSP70 family sugar kinase
MAQDELDESSANRLPDTAQIGSSPLGVREFNERLILRLVRRAGSIPKAEIARITHLSAQTVTVIVNQLLREKLLRKEVHKREKGKVGQPAMPIALNPEGAFSIGVKIGRRSLDVLLVDFLGTVVKRSSHRYDYPVPEQVFSIVDQALSALVGCLSETQRRRVVGIGAVTPFHLGSWPGEIRAPQEILSRWDEIDVRERIAAMQELPVWFSNDATAACVADLAVGNSAHFNNYLYIFVGTFIGGGVVLNGALLGGPFGNAAAIGSMPLPAHFSQVAEDAGKPTVQLIHCASKYLLDEQLHNAGFDPDLAIPTSGDGQSQQTPREVRDIVDTWIDKAGASLAVAITSAISVIDFEGIVIDGALPSPVTSRLTEIVSELLDAAELRGLERPRLVAGEIGDEARAMGGALLPLYWNFAPDREVLLKSAHPAVV